VGTVSWTVRVSQRVTVSMRAVRVAAAARSSVFATAAASFAGAIAASMVSCSRHAADSSAHRPPGERRDDDEQRLRERAHAGHPAQIGAVRS
jgi:hypothetical protein